MLIDDRLKIVNFYKEYDKNLILFIKGHLFLENAMNIILGKINVKTKKKTFYRKIQLMFDNSRINENTKELLERLNEVRNSIAHKLFYEFTFDAVFDLLVLSSVAGVDYSDDTIFEDKETSEEWYGIAGAVNELFVNTFIFLFDTNEDLFPDGEALKYMS